MTIIQCKNCIKIKGKGDKHRKYCCLYHKKSIQQIKECNVIDEYRIPACENNDCEGRNQIMDMVSKRAINNFDEYVFECLFCKSNLTITWSNNARL